MIDQIVCNIYNQRVIDVFNAAQIDILSNSNDRPNKAIIYGKNGEYQVVKIDKSDENAIERIKNDAKQTMEVEQIIHVFSIPLPDKFNGIESIVALSETDNQSDLVCQTFKELDSKKILFSKVNYYLGVDDDIYRLVDNETDDEFNYNIKGNFISTEVTQN